MAVNVNLDEQPTFGNIARHHARKRPSATALRFEGRDTSYAEFDTHTNQIANALIQRGLNAGSRVAYVGKNSDSYFELLFGATKAGIVVVPVNWRLAVKEIAFIVSDCDAELIFVGSENHAGLAEELTSKFPIIEMESEAQGGFFSWRDAASDQDPGTEITPDDIALQIYTSGTTGYPKGVMLSHRSVLSGWDSDGSVNMHWNEWAPEDVSLVAMPIGHIGGTGWGVVGLYKGALGVVVREFDPSKVLDFIEHERISKLFIVPSALQIVAADPRARGIDFSCLKYILYGASPIPLDLLQECMRLFECGFIQLYGMTETAGSIVYLPASDHDPKGNERMRSAGIALPVAEIQIVDENAQPVPVGTVGEIAIKSVKNMNGYWSREEDTAKTITEDGWLLSGDAGVVDEDGYVFIKDRVKDMIITGGENVYPAEVENALFSHPAVQSAAVIGVPDEKWGEAVKAVIVKKPEIDVNEQELLNHLKNLIAKFKIPKSVDIVSEMPVNATGKILKRELRAPYWANHDRSVN